MRRIALSAFFVSVAVNAALGIYAVLAPEFGDTQGKILGTSLCVTGAALLALACEPAWERRLLGSAPYLGTALGAVGFGLAIGGIWAEAESDTFLRVMASAFTIAVVCTVASLLVLSRPAPGHEWVFAATFGLLVLAGAAITVAIWLADEGPGRALGSMWTIVGAAAVATLLARARLSRGHERVLAVTFGLLTLGAALFAIVPWLGDDPSEWYLRTMGVILIALAAFTVTVPVLHWIDRAAIAGAESASGEIRRCPYCGSSVAGEAGVTLACRRCGRAFMVTGVESPSSANLT
jgi:hypothetical protein